MLLSAFAVVITVYCRSVEHGGIQICILLVAALELPWSLALLDLVFFQIIVRAALGLREVRTNSSVNPAYAPPISICFATLSHELLKIKRSMRPSVLTPLVTWPIMLQMPAACYRDEERGLVVRRSSIRDDLHVFHYGVVVKSRECSTAGDSGVAQAELARTEKCIGKSAREATTLSDESKVVDYSIDSVECEGNALML